MIEGGGSRHYLHAKKMMYNSPAEWDELMRKLVESPQNTPPRRCARAPM
jgi:uroporphyrinogen-III decarboxylase